MGGGGGYSLMTDSVPPPLDSRRSRVEPPSGEKPQGSHGSLLAWWAEGTALISQVMGIYIQ